MEFWQAVRPRQLLWNWQDTWLLINIHVHPHGPADSCWDAFPGGSHALESADPPCSQGLASLVLELPRALLRWWSDRGCDPTVANQRWGETCGGGGRASRKGFPLFWVGFKRYPSSRFPWTLLHKDVLLTVLDWGGEGGLDTREQGEAGCHRVGPWIKSALKAAPSPNSHYISLWSSFSIELVSVGFLFLIN